MRTPEPRLNRVLLGRLAKQRVEELGEAAGDPGVLHEATRPGSLDSSIVAGSQTVNDIAQLIARHRSIGLVAFNGQKAAEVFRRNIEVTLTRTDFSQVTLPSTSPAYASLRRSAKLARWRRVLGPHLRAAKA